MKVNNKKISRFLASLAISIVFIIFGIWEILQPNYWIGFVPGYASVIMSVTTLVIIHGLVLAILGVWLITGIKKKAAAILSALVMLDIIISVSEGGFSDVLVRDIGLFILTLSLIFDADN